MIAALVDIALRQRLITMLLALALVAWGLYSYNRLTVDAFPDVAPVQVLVSMRAPGLAPEELESRVTAPVEIAVRGVPNLVGMRSLTRYSVALMTFEFADGTDIYWARAQVNERLQDVRDQLPAGAEGGLAPVVTALGEMLMFTVLSDKLNAQETRSLIDWTIRPRLRGLPGVADVNVLGGYVRVFEVVPSAQAMAARGITTQTLEAVLGANNRNDGAGRVREGEEALLVRSEGRIRTLDDIRNIIIATKSNAIVRVNDIAEVREGALPRNGAVTTNGEGEAVWSTVLGLRGANAKTVVSAVKKRLKEIEPLLPDGAKIEIFYDRNDLIEKAVWTVQRVLIEATILVVVLLLLFLGNLRAAVVVAAALPLAVLSTFIIMRLFGWSANIMSLGGLAIAIGLLVDCAVVVVENVEHRIGEKHDPDLRARLRVTFDATKEVATPLVSGVIIIVTVFMPLLSLILSVPASVGFIALLGIAVLNGVVMVTYINDVLIGYLNEPAKTGFNIREAIIEAARRRVRPVTLTAAIAALGLVPFLYATGPGSEIQKPLAIVVIGGLVTATSLTLIMLPILYERFGLPLPVRQHLAEEGAMTGAPIRPVGATIRARWAQSSWFRRWLMLRLFLNRLRARRRRGPPSSLPAE